ncbi:unnamed protein product [Notodromas monacha]|uniref:Down syndrome cell adhesion molecule-like protein Dscam2 n=1 Tax=Notodromas monacha TaxID=399045 RepID=A0A7R9GIQ6_9CRUS|nr:unnamed protein product [Notodromas monacha]CAG0922836.1 unnamed protein product [Notodromas monacha]
MIDQTIGEATAVSMKCSASGRPTPTIQWALNGFPLKEIPDQLSRYMTGQYVTVHGIVVSHVNISAATSREGGIYSCAAVNSAGNTVHSAHLRVYGPPVIRDMPAQTAVVGKDFSVSCPVGGHPIHNITWRKETSSEGNLKEDGRFVLHPNGTLTVRFVQKSDGGKYVCKAFGLRGQFAENSVHITPAEPPNLASLSVDPELKTGDRATLNCVVKGGDSPMELRWSRDGVAVDAGALLPVLPAAATSSALVHRIDDFTSILVIRNITTAHAGNYSCQALNRAGVDTRTVTLLVNGMEPQIGLFSFGDNLKEGQRVQVLCHVNQGDSPVRILWYRDQTVPPSTSQQQGMVMRQVLPTHDDSISIQALDGYSARLIIPDLKITHAGNYSCEAINQVGAAKLTAQLVVSVPPRWTSEPQGEKSGLLGHRIILDCGSEAFPEPIVVWKRYKAGELDQFQEIQTISLEHSSEASWVHLKNQSLLTPALSKAHEGRYMCRVDNGIGSPLIRNFFVQVRAPPVLDETYGVKEGKFSFRLGDEGSLTCVATGDPPLSISWYVRGIKVSANSNQIFADPVTKRIKVSSSTRDSSTTSKLTIKGIELSDSGIYRCEADNPFGRTDRTLEISVLDAPGSPQNVTVESISSRGFFVRWRSPERNGNSFITKYHICLEHKISEPPAAAPTNLTADAISSRQIRIFYSLPDKSTWNGALLGIYAGIKLSSGPGIFNFTVLPMKASSSSSSSVTTGYHHEFTFDSLKPFTDYEIALRLFNGQGSGPLSSSARASTLEDGPEVPPQTVSCAPVSSTKVLISWNKIPSKLANGVLMGYEIVYTQADLVWKDESSKLRQKVGAAARESVVESLKKYSNYSFEVLGFTRAGGGPASVPVFCSTFEDKPGPPRGLLVKKLSPDTVIIAWEEPEKSNGVIQGYKVYLDPDPQSHSRGMHSVSSSSRYLQVGIGTRKTFDVYVAGVTSAGEGSSSPVVKFHTKDDGVPAAIYSFGGPRKVKVGTDLELACAHVGQEKLTLSWQFEPEGGLGFRPVLAHRSSDGLPWNEAHNAGIGAQGTLFLRPVQPGNAGTYKCTVSNDLATDSINYSVVVLEPPKPPMIAAVEEVSEGRVKVTWTPPVSNPDSVPPITAYQIFYRPSKPNHATKAVTVSGSTTNMVLKNLTCGTPYLVHAKAVNEIGASEKSAASHVQMSGNLPASPDAETAVVLNESDTVLVLKEWTARGCPILFFSVAYRLLGSNDWIIVASKVEPNETEFRLRGLNPNLEYEVKATAHSAPGQVVSVFRIGPEAFDKHADSSERLFAPFPVEIFSDPVVLVPVVGSLITMIIVGTGVCCFVRCQPDMSLPVQKRLETNSNNPDFSYHQQRSGSSGHQQTAGRMKPDEEISPYAVFEMNQRGDPGTATLNNASRAGRRIVAVDTTGTMGRSRRSVPEMNHMMGQCDVQVADVASSGGYSIPFATSRDSALASSLDTLRVLEDGSSNSATRKLTHCRDPNAPPRSKKNKQRNDQQPQEFDPPPGFEDDVTPGCPIMNPEDSENFTIRHMPEPKKNRGSWKKKEGGGEQQAKMALLKDNFTISV